MREANTSATEHLGMALRVLVAGIERRLRHGGAGRLPDAFLIGEQRQPLIEALRGGLLAHVAAIDWPTFARLAPVLCSNGVEGLYAAVALSLPSATAAGVASAVLDSLGKARSPRPRSVLFGRLTRPTGGHIIFRSQLLALADGEFSTTPLEMGGWLDRHTPAAIRAMLQGRLIRSRSDLGSEERQTLLGHATLHLEQLLPEAEAWQHSLLLLRLAYYRLHHPAAARQALNRVRVIDFTARRTAVSGNHARPRG